ncbi:hypothetical protein Gpo141_00012156 [Globisporangium polare]
MATKLVADDADALLVDGVCALEDYLNEHQRACEKLKQGFLKLAMARRNLSAHALSDLSYHEHFVAVTVVAARSNNDDDDEDTASDVRWTLTSPNSDSNPQPADTKSSSSTLTQRKGKGGADDTKSTADADPAELHRQQLDLQNSTIMWFSSLPPSDLRQAQKSFRSGKNNVSPSLQALIYAATSASKVQHSVSALEKM